MTMDDAPHLEDPLWPDDRVLGVARRHTRDATSVTGIDESGGEARVYFIDDSLLLKVQRPHRVRSWTSLRKEAALLSAVPVGAQVPRPVGHGIAHGVEYNVQTRVSGVPLDAALTPAQREHVLRQAGETLRSVHAASLDAYWLARMPARDVHTMKTLHDRALSEALTDCLDLDGHAIQRAWEDRWSRIHADVDHVPVNINIAPRHILVNEQSGDLAAVIDFGNAHLAPAALDVARWWPPIECEALLAGYARSAPLPNAVVGFIEPFAMLSAVVQYRKTGDRLARDELERLTGGK